MDRVLVAGTVVVRRGALLDVQVLLGIQVLFIGTVNPSFGLRTVGILPIIYIEHMHLGLDGQGELVDHLLSLLVCWHLDPRLWQLFLNLGERTLTINCLKQKGIVGCRIGERSRVHRTIRRVVRPLQAVFNSHFDHFW